MRRLLLLALLTLGCSNPKGPLPFEPANRYGAPDPSTRGPYAVGVRTATYVDTSRTEPDGGDRTLVTEIWYPAEPGTTGEGAEYDIWPLFTEEQQAQVADAGVTLPKLKTFAVRDAPLAADLGPYPVIIFSHGKGGMRWQSTYLTVTLASHGYVVVSPDHEDDTLYDILHGQQAETLVAYDFRPRDVQFLISRLNKLPDGDPLIGNIDLERLGVCGHSFGALTSLRVGAIDPRVKAIAPQAPTTTDLAWAGLAMPVDLKIPILLEGGHEDMTLPYEDNVVPAWAAVHHPRWKLGITHAGHFTFSDLCQFDLASIADHITLNVPGADVRKVLSDGCGPTAVPASVSAPLIDQFTIGFFNAELRGSTGSFEYLNQAGADRFGAGVADVEADP